MPQHQPLKPGFTWVRSTLPKEPYLPLEDRPTIQTERLLLKPYYEGAAEDLHPMRLQPEVMQWTSQGKPDKDLDETKAWVAQRLPPHHETNYSFIICLKDTGDVIGTGGLYRRACELGWPEVGYALRKEAWGKGYATEFVRAFFEHWWTLPREECLIEADQVTLSDEAMSDSSEPVVAERLCAVTLGENLGSQKVLDKMGFKKVKEWQAQSRDATLYGWFRLQ